MLRFLFESIHPMFGHASLRDLGAEFYRSFLCLARKMTFFATDKIAYESVLKFAKMCLREVAPSPISGFIYCLMADIPWGKHAVSLKYHGYFRSFNPLQTVKPDKTPIRNAGAFLGILFFSFPEKLSRIFFAWRNL